MSLIFHHNQKIDVIQYLFKGLLHKGWAGIFLNSRIKLNHSFINTSVARGPTSIVGVLIKILCNVSGKEENRKASAKFGSTILDNDDDGDEPRYKISWTLGS